MQKGEAHSPFMPELVHERMFAESENFMALYNLAPILPGHSLVVPKRYVTSLFELSDDELCELMLFSKKVVLILQRAFGITAFDWTLQEGEEAGQTVAHLHLHIIPRGVNDLNHPGDWYEKIIDSQSRTRLTDIEMRKIVEHIKKFVLPAE